MHINPLLSRLSSSNSLHVPCAWRAFDHDHHYAITQSLLHPVLSSMMQILSSSPVNVPITFLSSLAASTSSCVTSTYAHVRRISRSTKVLGIGVRMRTFCGLCLSRPMAGHRMSVLRSPEQAGGSPAAALGVFTDCSLLPDEVIFTDGMEAWKLNGQ